jgi:hypothetical protein
MIAIVLKAEQPILEMKNLTMDFYKGMQSETPLSELPHIFAQDEYVARLNNIDASDAEGFQIYCWSLVRDNKAAFLNARIMQKAFQYEPNYFRVEYMLNESCIDYSNPRILVYVPSNSYELTKVISFLFQQSNKELKIDVTQIMINGVFWDNQYESLDTAVRSVLGLDSSNPTGQP